MEGSGVDGSGIELPADVSTWTIVHVNAWLRRLDLEPYAQLLCEQHKVDGRVLLMLSEDDLRLPPLQLEVLGDAKRLWWHISRLQASRVDDTGAEAMDNGAAGFQLYGLGCERGPRSQRFVSNSSQRSPWNPTVFSKRRRRGATRRHSRASEDLSVSDSDVGSNEPVVRRSNAHQPINANGSNLGSPTHARHLATNLQPEISKLLIAFGYFLLSTWVTAFVMVIVHDRVPDMNTHPPLPDIVLDNVPLIPWAFPMSEVCATLMSLISVVVLILHKHRFILMRRFFALSGTIFLLRCVTMLITSLSVPGKHLNCKARDPGGDLMEKFWQALEIWRGAGLSLKGVRSCGDYMFSGHTVALTLLNFFITEYTNRRMYFLHTLTWLLNMFGIFFILAAHEHYSIDVFIAFYISSRLFLYYHTLANNKTFKETRSSRTRVWFPMLSYFERSVDGIVPNEYEWPFTWHYWQSIIVQVLPFLKRAQQLVKDTAKTAERVARSKRDMISTKLRRDAIGDESASPGIEIQACLSNNVMSHLSDTEPDEEYLSPEGAGDDGLSWANRNEGLRKRSRKRPAVR